MVVGVRGLAAHVAADGVAGVEVAPRYLAYAHLRRLLGGPHHF